jgi:hypothetical protein
MSETSLMLCGTPRSARDSRVSCHPVSRCPVRVDDRSAEAGSGGTTVVVVLPYVVSCKHASVHG